MHVSFVRQSIHSGALPHYSGIFLGLIWGFILSPSQFKNEQKLPKMMYIIPNFLVLHFGENFMKIRTKIAKLQMHEIFIKMWIKMCFHSHFHANFREFLRRANKPITNALHCLFFILCFLIHLKWQSSSLRPHQIFLNFGDPNAFFPNSTGPWPQHQKGRKIPATPLWV